MRRQAVELAKNLAELQDLVPVLEDSDLRTLSKFPHIVEKVALFWGFEEAPEYLQSLTFDDRCGRQGFPADMLLVVHKLSQIHDEQYPKFAKKNSLPFSC